MYKLSNMNELHRFILESHFDPDFAKTVYESISLFEAVNINKAFLLQAAGSPEALQDAKKRVAGVWDAASMDGVVRGGNVQQKLFNFLYLMEIREPGFTTRDVMAQIHDLSIHGSLEQKFLSKVNSDTAPAEAAAILADADSSAVQNAKAYPGLTADEEKVWNRVKVYHEFPDGFRWVYALNSSGAVSGYMPSRITAKTMHHCGNEPSHKAGDEYWELRDGNGKAYLTVILNADGQIEESKSWGNQENKYRQQILPYVKWLLKDRKVTGVGQRYDYGYATHMNFGVKDFIGDDTEFVDYVVNRKPDLIGATESRILFWKDAVDRGIITVDDLKRAYEGNTRRSVFMKEFPEMEEYAETSRFRVRDTNADPADSMFGANSFAVLCAACGGNPFTEDELAELIRSKKLSLAVFANYSIRLLTPRLQEEFVKANPNNLDQLIEISNQVAAFNVEPSLWLTLVPSEAEISAARDPEANGSLLERCLKLMSVIGKANPPSKMADAAKELMKNGAFLKFMYSALCCKPGHFADKFGHHIYCMEPARLYVHMADILGKYPDIPLPPGFAGMHARMLSNNMSRDKSGAAGWDSIIKGEYSIGGPRNVPLLEQYTDSILSDVIVSAGYDADLHGYQSTKETTESLCKLFTGDRIISIATGDSGKERQGDSASLIALAASIPDSEMLDSVSSSALNKYFYEPVKKNGTDYYWSKDNGPSYNEKCMYCAIFDLLVNRQNLVHSLDWHDKRTYYGMAGLIARFGEYKIHFSKEGVENVILTMVDALYGNLGIADALWHDNMGFSSYKLTKFPTELARLVLLYGIDNRLVPAFFRVMAERDMAKEESGIVGAWSIFEIPFNEWMDEYGKYGFEFINDYVVKAPADTMNDNEFITGFVCDRIVDGSLHDVSSMAYKLDNRAQVRQRACISRMITKRIMDNDLPLDERKFNLLFETRLISAEAYRTVMSRRADRGVPEIKDAAAVGNVIKAFGSIQKLDALPELIAATVRYIVELLYDNMGDGRYRWKVDENCSHEASMLAVLCGKLASKATVGNVPKAIKRLFDDRLVERLREFPAANRAACDTPDKPRSKITCSVTRDVVNAVEALDKVHDAAFAAADRPAKVAKRKSLAKKRDAADT